MTERTITKVTARILVENLALIQRLPYTEQIAIAYYIKGRFDATAGAGLEPAKLETQPQHSRQVAAAQAI